MATNKTIFLNKKFWAGVLLAQFVLFFIFSKIDFLVEWFSGFFEFQKEIHQQLFSIFSFSFGDLLYLFLIILMIYLLFKKSWLKILIFLNVLYFFYQLFWGILYFQKPIIDSLPGEKPTLEETKLLAIKYLIKCKIDRQAVNEDRNGVFKIRNLPDIKNEILRNQASLPKTINDKKPTFINSMKKSLYVDAMSYSGILGYYNPFTAEAQLNALLPSSQIPITLAHETSHQLGFAREQEASFIGYLVGKDSKNADLKYSTDYYALKSLLNSIIVKDSTFVKETLKHYSSGMKRDRIYEKTFVKKHTGTLDAIFGFTNNLFLKSNQQEGSVTYSYFVDLLIRYERSEAKRKESRFTTRFQKHK